MLNVRVSLWSVETLQSRTLYPRTASTGADIGRMLQAGSEEGRGEAAVGEERRRGGGRGGGGEAKMALKVKISFAARTAWHALEKKKKTQLALMYQTALLLLLPHPPSLTVFKWQQHDNRFPPPPRTFYDRSPYPAPTKARAKFGQNFSLPPASVFVFAAPLSSII